jgi:hypothetical protein
LNLEVDRIGFLISHAALRPMMRDASNSMVARTDVKQANKHHTVTWDPRHSGRHYHVLGVGEHVAISVLARRHEANRDTGEP